MTSATSKWNWVHLLSLYPSTHRNPFHVMHLSRLEGCPKSEQANSLSPRWDLQGARQVQACPYLLSRRQDNSHVDTQSSTPSVTSREVNPDLPPSSHRWCAPTTTRGWSLDAVMFERVHRCVMELIWTKLHHLGKVVFLSFFFSSKPPEHNGRMLEEITRFTSTGISEF